MLDNKIKQDIICEIGGICSKEDIKNVFRQYLNNEHCLRMETIQNHDVCMKIANAIALCNPNLYILIKAQKAIVNLLGNLPLKWRRKTPCNGKSYNPFLT